MSRQFNIDYAIVSAFERSKEERPRAHGTRTFSIVLLAVFFVVMMACLAAGALQFQDVSRSRAQANDMHMQTGLLANIVRVNDAADALEVGAGPEGDALVLVERLDGGTYETRVYEHDGAIVQEYAIAGRPYNPDEALKIIDSKLFEFAYADGLLTFITDDGTWSVALRSPQSLPSPTASRGYAAAAGAPEAAQVAEGGT